jgi:hypothetical protein
MTRDWQKFHTAQKYRVWRARKLLQQAQAAYDATGRVFAPDVSDALAEANREALTAEVAICKALQSDLKESSCA